MSVSGACQPPSRWKLDSAGCGPPESTIPLRKRLCHKNIRKPFSWTPQAAGRPTTAPLRRPPQSDRARRSRNSRRSGGTRAQATRSSHIAASEHKPRQKSVSIVVICRHVGPSCVRKLRPRRTPDRNSSMAVPHKAVSCKATRRHGSGNHPAATTPTKNGTVRPKPNRTSRAGTCLVSETSIRRCSVSVRARPRLLRVPSNRSPASPSP